VNFFELCARTLVCPEPIAEIGAFQLGGQEAISDLRPLFPEKAFIGFDIESGPGVDPVEDIHKLSFRSGEVGTHGYPNDYWRFTPGAFRALAAEFPLTGIFFCRSREFPHTVCGVAAKNEYDVAAIKALTHCGATSRRRRR
jgi:hypothetical protein